MIYTRVLFQSEQARLDEKFRLAIGHADVVTKSIVIGNLVTLSQLAAIQFHAERCLRAVECAQLILSGKDMSE